MKKLFVLFVCILCLCGCTKIEVKEENLVYEYGEHVVLDVHTVLHEDTKDNVLQEAILDVPLSYTNKKKYPDVGTYECKVLYKNKEIPFTITIQDTTKPKFTHFKDTITIEQDAPIKYKKFFTYTDLSPCTLSIDDSKVHIDTIGDYTLTVICKDKYKNTRKKEVKVHVISMEDAINQGVTKYVDGSICKSDKRKAYEQELKEKEEQERLQKEKEEKERQQQEEKQQDTVKPSTSNAPTASGSAIVAAAYAQLGSGEVCTKVVEHAINAVGLSGYFDLGKGFKELECENFFRLGREVSLSEARPGDIVYYNDAGAGMSHVAIYVGNNKAIHGNFMGVTTEYSIYVPGGTSPRFIQITK